MPSPDHVWLPPDRGMMPVFIAGLHTACKDEGRNGDKDPWLSIFGGDICG